MQHGIHDSNNIYAGKNSVVNTDMEGKDNRHINQKEKTNQNSK